MYQNPDQWEPEVEKLINSVDNGSVSFTINLNFDIQNLTDLRSFGIFPKIRPWKKLTKKKHLSVLNVVSKNLSIKGYMF